MKQFLYLDTSLIASYMAQVDGGKAIKRHFSAGDTTEEQRAEPSDEFATGVDVQVPSILKGTLNYVSRGLSTAFTQTRTGIEMVEFAVHDEIFANMLAHLRNTESISDSYDIGKYTHAQGTFRVIDLNWLSTFALNYAQWQHNLENPKTLNRQQRRQVERKGQKDTNNATQPTYDVASMENNVELVKLMELVLPSTYIVQGESMLSFIKKEYLRDNTASILLKSYNILNLVGFVYGEYKETTVPDVVQAQKTVPMFAINVLSSLGVDIYEGLRLVEPIAIYYDESDCG